MNKIVMTLMGALLFFCQSGAIFAQKVFLEVQLSEIKKIQATESGGDELYFNVTEYSSIERARHYQVPDFPIHWLSGYLDGVKGVSLWEKNVGDQEAIVLILSLVERDVPPWNVDDLIGSVKLKLRNNKGKIEKKWSIPNKENTVLAVGEENTFIFTGDGGKYHITLRLQDVD